MLTRDNITVLLDNEEESFQLELSSEKVTRGSNGASITPGMVYVFKRTERKENEKKLDFMNRVLPKQSATIGKGEKAESINWRISETTDGSKIGTKHLFNPRTGIFQGMGFRTDTECGDMFLRLIQKMDIVAECSEIKTLTSRTEGQRAFVYCFTMDDDMKGKIDEHLNARLKTLNSQQTAQA